MRNESRKSGSGRGGKKPVAEKRYGACRLLLHFTLARRVEFAEIRAGLEEVYELVAQASGIRFSFEAEDRQTHVNSYTFYLRYQGPLPTSNTVKVFFR